MGWCNLPFPGARKARGYVTTVTIVLDYVMEEINRTAKNDITKKKERTEFWRMGFSE